VATAGTPVSVSLTITETTADFESPPITRSDTSISYDHPAFVSFKPQRGSLLSKWHGSAQGDQAFALTCPSGSTVDFDFDYVVNDLGGVLTSIAISGANVGQIYHKIQHSLTPVAVNSI
jgi:hypothetical protein